MTRESDIERLSQAKNLARIFRDISASEMMTVYWSAHTDIHYQGIYSALIPSSEIDRSLGNVSWDLAHGHGLPGASVCYENNEKVISYDRFGFTHGIEPLVIDREFHGMRPDYKEICEEFRLFHRLFHDTKENKYIKITDAGSEEVIAIVEQNRIQIRLQELRQFLAIKEMHLAIQFDYVEYSQHSLKELAIELEVTDHRDDVSCWCLNYGNGDGLCSFNAFSRLCGKRLITPLPKEKSGFWGYAEEADEKCVEFIIGVDDNGAQILHTSDPKYLANNFGANPEAPNYLTPVHFRKAVLDKYYNLASKFSVEDSYLRCGCLWGLQMDNHHADKVCAWLGDLGRDLPYEEQLHWRSYNIAPVGSVSDVYFRRQIMAEFAESKQPEHIFKNTYNRLNEACAAFLGWQLLLPLMREDNHYLAAIRIPTTEEQSDFDELVLALTKTLVDSLNEKKLNTFIPQGQRPDIKGSISRLEYALNACCVDGHEEHILFLRNLQNLRSSGTAHRKGSNYEKIASEFNIENTSLNKVFEGILRKANALLQFLNSTVRSNKLTHPPEN